MKRTLKNGSWEYRLSAVWLFLVHRTLLYCQEEYCSSDSHDRINDELTVMGSEAVDERECQKSVPVVERSCCRSNFS